MVRDYDDEALPSVYNVEEIPGMEVAGGSTMKVFRGLDLMLGFSSLDPDLDELSAYSHPADLRGEVRTHRLLAPRGGLPRPDRVSGRVRRRGVTKTSLYDHIRIKYVSFTSM
jgi:hypothetical protein